MATPEDESASSRIAVYNALYDPVVCRSGDGAALTQVHVRRVSDAFYFAPSNPGAAILRWEHSQDPPVRRLDVVLHPGKVGSVEGVAWFFGPGSESHGFISPIVAGGHDTHFWWRIEAPHVSPGLRVGPVARFIQRLEGGESHTIDLLSDEARSIDVRVGDGFQITIMGESYAFFVLFRLVQHADGEASVSFRVTDAHLEIGLAPSREPVWFIVTPHPHREMKLVMGREAAALRLGVSAMISCDPIPPRDHFILSMAPLDPRETPISALPMAGPPRSVYCPMLIESGEQIVWPAPGKLAAREIADTITSLVFVGCPSEETLRRTFGSFAPTIGWMGAPSARARDVLYAASGVKLDADAGDMQSFQLGDDTGAFMDYPADRDFESVFEKFFAFIDAKRRASLPDDITEPAERHWRSRLPALPHCMDLGLAMAIAVINRHRGRLTKDDGSMVLEYASLQTDALWITSWDRVTSDRSALLVELIFRATAEYVASAFASDLKPWRVLETGGGWQCPSIEWDARPYLEIFEQSALTDERQAAVQQFLGQAKASGVKAEGAMAVLADALLKRFRADRAAGEDAASKGLARLNPLVLLVTEGEPASYDPRMEIAAGYWASYAAAFAVAKPSALIPTLMHKGMLDDVRACQRDLRQRVHTARSVDDAVNVAAARIRLGDLVGSELERASVIVARTLGADRIVAISAVMLDFVPYAGTILGLEIPLSRAPLSEAGLAPFAVPTNVVASSYTGRNFDRCCVLGAHEPRDGAEVSAMEIRDSAIGWLTYAGIEVVEPSQSLKSVIDSAEACGLVVFVGHAEDKDGVAGLDLGGLWLRKDDLNRIDWTGKIVILLGCETGAVDGANWPDHLIVRGARAVVATTAKLDARIADVFLQMFLHATTEGMAIDYAFFGARRRAVIVEALMARGVALEAALKLHADKLGDRPSGRSFSSHLAEVGLDWDYTYRAALYSLSLTLVGGAGEHL